MGWKIVPVEERADRQAKREARFDELVERREVRNAEIDAEMDVDLAEGVRTGLNAVRAVITGLVFLWIIFWGFLAILVVPKDGVGAAIAFSFLIVPAVLYAKRSVKLLLQKDRRSGPQTLMHDAIRSNQERRDAEGR